MCNHSLWLKVVQLNLSLHDTEWPKRQKLIDPSHGNHKGKLHFITGRHCQFLLVETGKPNQLISSHGKFKAKGLFRVSFSPQIHNLYSPSFQVEAQNFALSHLLVCFGKISPTSNCVTHPRRILYRKPFDWYHVCFFFLCVHKKTRPFTQQPLSAWHFTSLLFVFLCSLPTACHRATAFHAHLITY